jgi:hypothetical protein
MRTPGKRWIGLFSLVLLVVTGCFAETERRAVQRFAQNVSEQSRGARIIGHIYHATTIPPCYKCGRGNVCHVGGLWHIVGRDKEKLKAFKATRDMFERWEDCPETVAQVSEYARVLSELGG